MLNRASQRSNSPYFPYKSKHEWTKNCSLQELHIHPKISLPAAVFERSSPFVFFSHLPYTHLQHKFGMHATYSLTEISKWALSYSFCDIYSSASTTRQQGNILVQEGSEASLNLLLQQQLDAANQRKSRESFAASFSFYFAADPAALLLLVPLNGRKQQRENNSQTELLTALISTNVFQVLVCKKKPILNQNTPSWAM